MVSKRMKRRLANRAPHWRARAARALESADAAVATAWDRTRYLIRHSPAAQRDGHWQALTVELAVFNIPFVGPPDQATPEGRLAQGERRFKARHVPVDGADAQYDTARKHIRWIEPTGAQETKWRELEALLLRFNGRFTRAVAA